MSPGLYVQAICCVVSKTVDGFCGLEICTPQFLHPPDTGQGVLRCHSNDDTDRLCFVCRFYAYAIQQECPDLRICCTASCYQPVVSQCTH